MRLLSGLSGGGAMACAVRAGAGACAPAQGLTFVNYSAERKHILWDTCGCMIFPKSIRQGDKERCDLHGLG